MAVPRPVLTAVENAQLSLGLMEIPASNGQLWIGLPAEHRAVAVTALARLIAKTMNSEENDRG